MVTKDFLKEVLIGRKSFLKMKDVNFCNPPAYDEIGVKNLFVHVVSMEGMSMYFPDEFPKGRTCDKSYMYNVWNTLYPDDVKAVIQHANQLRYGLTADRVKDETIIVNEEWQREILSLPYVSK